MFQGWKYFVVGEWWVYISLPQSKIPIFESRILVLNRPIINRGKVPDPNFNFIAQNLWKN